MYKYKMKSYCLKCRKDTENIKPKVLKTSNGRTKLLSNCAIRNSKNSRFFKNEETKGLLSNLGLRTPLSKVYWVIFCFECNSVESYKMNETVNKFLLAGDKFLPEMHLEQPGFTYSACGSFTKNKERIQKFK